MNISLKMKEDPETDKAFGWVLEMYVLPKNLIDIFVLEEVLELIVFCFMLMIFFLVEPRYAYAVASALHGVRHILRKDFMLQVWHDIISLNVVFNICCYQIKL